MAENVEFPVDKVKIILQWLIKPENYKKRSEITNFLKNYYKSSDLINYYEKKFNEFSTYILSRFSNDDNEYIHNAEQIINNCLKFDELDGYQSLFLYIFFLHPPLINKFWNFVFYGEPLITANAQTQIKNDSVNFTSGHHFIPNKKQIRAENTDRFIDALCSVIDYVCEMPDEMKEFIYYFVSRFLDEGLKNISNNIISSRLAKIIQCIQKFLIEISHHQTFCEYFSKCCNAFHNLFDASSKILDDLSFDAYMNRFVVDFLNDLSCEKSEFYSPTLLACFLDNFLNKIKVDSFKNNVQKVFSIVLEIGLKLTYDFKNFQPELMRNCLEFVNIYFNKVNFSSNDSKLITNCLHFFYLNRFYKPFCGITQKLLQKIQHLKIDLEMPNDIIIDAFNAEKEDNEEDGGNSDKECKEYIQFFNEIRRRDYNENNFLVDPKLLYVSIQEGIKNTYQMNLNDIEMISPIEKSCRQAFKEFFDQQILDNVDIEQNDEENISLFMGN